MNARRTLWLATLSALVLVALAVVPALAQTSNFGPRIPIHYIATMGTGQSDDGIPPDPYETFSYDLALKEAGIENFNVVYYTSVLPKDAYEVEFNQYLKAQFVHGTVLESIMAKAGGIKGDTVCAGIGRVWAMDSKGEYIGGFAAEYEYVYSQKYVSKEQAYEDAKKQLTKSLQHELDIRGLKQAPVPMKFNITSLQITNNYGMALSCLGFVNFIYPPPLKVQPIER